MASKKKARPEWDQMKKPRADAKLKRLPEDVQWTMWEMRNPTDPTVTAATMEDVLVFLLNRHDLIAHLSSFSEWESWYGLKLRMQNATARREQAMEEFLKRNPDASDEALNAEGDRVFKVEALVNKDSLNWTRLRKLGQLDATVEQNKTKLAQNDTKLAHDARRIALLEKKAAQADEARGVMGDATLSPEQKQERLKGIFGMG